MFYNILHKATFQMKHLPALPALHMDMLMALRMRSRALVAAEFIPGGLVLHDFPALHELVEIPVNRGQVHLYTLFLHIFIDVIGTEAVFPVCI
jgi:hypothetical protein